MFQCRCVPAAAAAACLLLAVTLPVAAAAGAGKATVRYDAPKDKELRPAYEALKERKLLEEEAEAINKSINLPTNLVLTGAQCDEANAFYSPDDHSVTLCYELIDDYAELYTKAAGAKGMDEAALVAKVMGGTEFALNHEVGHALIHLLDLPSTGKEEDAVDQFSTFVLVKDGDEHGIEAALAEAHSYLLNAKEEEKKHEKPDFSDEHSLDAQRFYNITCWVFGSDPDGFKELVEKGLLPQERAVRCPREWEQTVTSWEKLLGPFYKDAAK